MSYRNLNNTTGIEDVILDRDASPAVLNIVVRLDEMVDELRVANRAMAGNMEELVATEAKQKREIQDLTERLNEAQDILKRIQI